MSEMSAQAVHTGIGTFRKDFAELAPWNLTTLPGSECRAKWHRLTCNLSRPCFNNNFNGWVAWCVDAIIATREMRQEATREKFQELLRTGDRRTRHEQHPEKK